MIILEETGTAQTFKVVPRELVADSMVITNELTDVSETYLITPTVDRYYLVIEEVLNLKEGNFYTLTVLNSTDVVYKGKIFCTNQSISTYSVNNNEYTSYSSTNDYVTYE
jgi:hypothetical protein